MQRKKVLIYGMSPIVGGVENYIITVLQNIDQSKFDIDLIVKEDITGINGEGINGYYKNIYKMHSIYRHPLKALNDVKKISRIKEYDVAHFNISLSSSVIFALILKIYSKKTKILIHSHCGNATKKIRHYIFRPIVNLVADKKIACSEIAAKWMFGNKSLKNNEVILMNNFVNTDKFLYNERIRNKIRTDLHIEDKFVIGHIGRFNFIKNHKELIDIFARIASTNDNVVLILIGTGELEESIKEYVNNLKLNSKVFFLGLKNNVNEYYQAMDLFVLPSFSEGLPIVGIEAQTSGLMCLFANTIDKKSDISGNVIFLPLNNLELWEEKINEIIISNYERKNLKKKVINAGYDLKNEIKKIEKLYMGK